MTSRTEMRRKERAVTDDAWMQALLQRAAVGVMATSYDDQPYITSNLFVYDPGAHCLYLHTAKAGRFLANIEHNPRIAFTVMEMGRLLPADTSLEFSVEYASVVIFGTVQIVTDPDDATRALQLLLDKSAPHLLPGVDYRPPVESELKRTAVFRVTIEEWSGKQKSAPADFPGAYVFDPR